MRHATAYALLVLLVAGCGQSDKTAKGNSPSSGPPQASATLSSVIVSGQVFIVTKGRDNIKLALVEVAALPEDLLLDHIQKKRSLGLAQRSQMAPELVSAMKEALVARKAADAGYTEQRVATQRARAAWSQGPYRSGTEEYDQSIKTRAELDEKQRETMERYSVALQRANTKEAASLKVQVAVTYFDQLDYYLTDLPSHQATTKTDADGRFTLVPPGKFVLAATTSRRVGLSSEVYHWLVLVDTLALPTPLMLSNDNMFETKCSQCVKLPAPLPLPI